MGIVRTLCIFTLLAQSVTLSAGDRWNVRAVGMGRTSVALSRGTEAIGINPANLALPGRGTFSLSLMPIGVRASTEMLSYDIYQEYFTGIPGTDNNGKRDPKVLTELDKQNILASIPDGLAATRVDIEAMDLGATIATSKLGGLGVAVLDHASGTLEIAKDFTRFFLYGLDSAGSQYNFDGTSVAAAWWREFNVSYAYQIPLNSEWVHELSIGLGVKLLQGFGIFETEHYSSSIANQRVGANQYLLNAQFDYLTRRAGADFFNPDKHVDMSMFPEPAGKGVGFDLGVSAQIKPGLRVAASVTDIGSIHWTKNLVKTDGRYALIMDDPFKTENTDSLEQAVRGNNQAGDAFSSTLPTTLRIGVAIESDESAIFSFLPRKMLLAFDYTQGLNSSMGNLTQPRFSLGMEYRVISFLPLRTGISMGGGDGVRWAAGFGLDFYTICLDIATENFGMIFSKKIPQNVSVAAGLRVLI
ncbi:MAG: DUF5723 family protein [Ignavibacteriales bacterium]|nr:DUF5723 family protein [Ignavibacteriales bacterium]